ncbi:MAG: GNAT family N-acetyltransferase [Gemmataceae bacterium]|nr:GNAT family N-acetyltransferase [Gemmataceae bacterium]MCI0741231.1 GNAT family N-acetyltransferase [Gemmataceae bacterium]
MRTANNKLAKVSVRSYLRPGDIGAVATLHGLVYAREYGFDATFEAYVAAALAEFVLLQFEPTEHTPPRQCIWIAEHSGRVVGSIAIVAASEDAAQLRWFLVDPALRGAGLGRRLLNEAVAFCQSCQYRSVYLWTTSALTAAAHLYRCVGFQKVADLPGRRWGAYVVEEKYELSLS